MMKTFGRLRSIPHTGSPPGGSHNSVAVEFKDFVTLIEGPLISSAHSP